MRILILALFLSSCGIGESLRTGCGSDIEMGCNALFGYTDKDQDKAIAAIEDKNDEQDEKLLYLQNQVDAIIDSINGLSSLNDINLSMINSLQNSTNSILIQMIAMNASITTLEGDVANLNSSTSVAQVIDPCGDGPGFDQVLLKTSDGKLITYIQHGNSRFLALLTPGNYSTTDNTGCNFTVTASGAVTF